MGPIGPFSLGNNLISLIYATCLTAVIGRNGDLPWPHLAADMKWFIHHTKNKIVVMGRTTWESLPKKLPNRINIVITNQELTGPDMLVKGTPDEVMAAIKAAYPDQDMVIIGGAKVYQDFYEYAEQVHVTLVQENYQGDAYFDMRGLMQQSYKLEYEVKLPGGDSQPDLLFETYSRPKH
ncbi:Dihydrofolate reductase [compost metagenome]